MVELLKVLSFFHSKSLPFLINTIALIFAILGRSKLVRILSIVFICHLTFYVYFQRFSQDLLYRPEFLLITDAYNIDSSCSLPVLEILKKSYIPSCSDAYIYGEGKERIEFSNNGYSNLCNEYDPRLLPALWLSYLSVKLKQESFKNVDELRIPFTWNTFLDLQSRLNIPHTSLRNLNCVTFCDLHKLNGTDFLENCQDLKKEIKGSSIQFKILRPIDLSASEEVRKIIGLSYLLHSAPLPEKVFLLGVGPNRSSLIIPTYSLRQQALYDKSDFFHLIENLVIPLSGPIDKSISIYEEVHKIKQLLSLPIANISDIPDDELTHDIFRLIRYGDTHSKRLSKDDFLFHLEEFKSQLKGKLVRCLNPFDAKLLSQIDMIKSTLNKYFHEAMVLREKDNHYDWRFFKQTNYSQYERKAILHRLTRAWLRFSNTLGIKTWVAHGSMLGWYWNGMSLPWDQDLDVQITMKSLIKIAKYYNQTLVVDLSDQDYNLNPGVGSYLLDVSSTYFDRQRGEGKNTIDARFVDTETGFYVDITALAFTNAANDISINDKAFSEFNQVLDNDFVMKDTSHTVLKEDLYKDLSLKRTELWNHHNIFNCKDNHFYTLEDLDPLIPTLFEGSLAYVPSGFRQILQREYNRGLLYYQYAEHIFRPVLDLWVPNYICKDDYIGNNCFDKETLLEVDYTKPLTRIHRTEMLTQIRESYSINDELGPFRLDPWIIKRGNKIMRYLDSR